jgi:hypothetical protein
VTATRPGTHSERRRSRRSQTDELHGTREALEDLDPAGDLDGSVRLLVDAGVRLLGSTGPA